MAELFEAAQKLWIASPWGAAFKGDEQRLRELLDGPGKHQIDLQERDGDKLTPLHYAASYGHLSCVELLLGAGAEKNCQDSHGITPLNWASVGNHTSVVSVLLAAGADVDLAAKEYHPPLRWATSMGHSAVVALLLDAGADKVTKDVLGRTALDFAIWQKKDEVVAVFREHEHRELVVRPAVVAALFPSILPAELAEECGDFIHYPLKRRRRERLPPNAGRLS